MKYFYDATVIYAILIVTVAMTPGIILIVEMMK